MTCSCSVVLSMADLAMIELVRRVRLSNLVQAHLIRRVQVRPSSSHMLLVMVIGGGPWVITWARLVAIVRGHLSWLRLVIHLGVHGLIVE